MLLYSEAIRPHKLVNLSSQLKTPTLVAVDINLPCEDGKIAQDSLRMRVYAHELDMLSDYAGLVVTGHQGNKGDDDFTSFKPHYKILFKRLPDDIELFFIPYNEIFTEDGLLTKETERTIKNLERRQIVLFDNLRYFGHEKKYDRETSPYMSLRGLVKTCVNDAISALHRGNSRLMCMPDITQTYVGMRTSYELGVIENIMTSQKSKALLTGGSKTQKISDLEVIYGSGVRGFAGGLNGQLLAMADGHDLGEVNNRFLKRKFKPKELDDAKKVLAYGVKYPAYFKVQENGDFRDIPLSEMRNSRGLIVDIGGGTVDEWSEELQAYELRCRAGPLGIFEKGHNNGIELTKRIAGDGLVFFGGDTSQEVIQNGLDEHIVDSGGQILISGGAAIHRWAGGSFPSLDSILNQKINRDRLNQFR